MDEHEQIEALRRQLETSETISRAWVRIAAELTWMGDSADTGLSLDSLEGRTLMLLTMRPFWLMSVLRERVGTSRSTMTRLIGRFEQRGWVVRSRPSRG
jgi:DNA-binding MarR family transcriptional regulator